MIAQMDVNCDMGENFGHWKVCDVEDKDILPFISSANVATGFHAGDPNHMDQLARLAKEHNVNVGAHPGYRDLQGFGRRKIAAHNAELINDVLYQVGALKEFCNRYGTKLTHVKPHGALYMEMAANESLSRDFVQAMKETNPNIPIFCMHYSHTYRVAKELGQPVIREFFADKDYDDSGSIVFTRHGSKADIEKIWNKVLLACKEQKVITVTGNKIDMPFESICFHSDTPGSIEIAKAIKEGFKEYGITMSSDY